MSRRRRRIAIILGGMLALAVTFVVGVRLYLSSAAGRALVRDKLQALYGGPVELDAVDIGWRGMTIHGLRLFEAGPDAAGEPWLQVADVWTDVTFGEVLRGVAAPRQVQLAGAQALLRFDEAGHLLTRLPSGRGHSGAWPHIALTDTQVTLRQAGRPDLTIQNVRAEVRSDAGRLLVAGRAADTVWGEWTLDAVVDPAGSAHTLALKSPAVAFDGALLKLLPFIPAAVWQQVEAAGVTAAEIRVWYDPAEARVHYRAELKPAGISGRLAVLELSVDELRGQIVIENQVVHFRDITCRTADGTLAGNGELDFGHTLNRVLFQVAARRLDLRRLPASWGLPEKIAGRLTGQADLQLHFENGRPTPRGTGQAVIEEAKLGGVPAEPIRLRLGPAKEQLRFVPDQDDPQGRAPRAPAVALLCCLQAPPPLVVEVDARLKDADLAELLRGLAVETPVAISGRGSAEITLLVPVDGARNPKTYRVQGRLHAPVCRVAGLELRDLRADVAYADGVLDVLDGRAALPAPDGKPGTLTTTARLELFPSGQLTAKFQMEHAVQPVLQSLLAGAGIPVSGLVSGGGEVSVPIDRLREVAAWQARGMMASPRLAYRPWAIDEVRAALHLADGVLSIPQFSAKLDGAALEGEARLPLDAASASRAVVRFTDLDAAWVAQQANIVPVALDGKLHGTAELTIPAAGKGEPRVPVLQVETQSSRVRVEGIAADRVQAGLTWRNGQAEYRVQGDLLGGRLQLNGQWPGEGRLRLERVLLSRWHQLVADALRAERIRGRLDLDLTFRREGEGEGEGEPATLTGTGRVTLTRLRWGDVELAETVAGDLLLTPEQLQVPSLSGNVAGGLLFGQLNWDLNRPERRRIRLRVQQAESARLLAFWPGIAAGSSGPVDLRYNSSLGKEWRGTAEVSMARGWLAGLEVAEWRVPARVSYCPVSGRGELEVPETQVQAAQGRAQGQLNLTWGEDQRLDARVTFFGVKLRSLLSTAGIEGIGSGDLNGRLELSGSNVRSADDLTGSLDATLKQGQIFDLPLFKQLARFIAPGQAASAFHDGQLRARLNRGVVQVEWLRLRGPFLQAQLTGTVTLQGRLDMEATANPGLPGEDMAAIRVLGMRMPAVGALPSTLINQASGFLVRRLIHLDINGTVRNPAIQVRPLRNLSGDALRFFLTLPGR
ncbi:MAG: DUF748 domain-containing protein [Planctomycetia bacterium]|nr:DUF748 domain-containing protein [Planctomycetia bacterium]